MPSLMAAGMGRSAAKRAILLWRFIKDFDLTDSSLSLAIVYLPR
jgi:hypothetical protein